MKYLIWLVIAVAVVVWVQRAKKSLTAAGGAANGARGARGARGPQRRQQQPEVMVQCAHCGIHFPASEAFSNPSGLVFCSDEHLRLAAR